MTQVFAPPLGWVNRGQVTVVDEFWIEGGGGETGEVGELGWLIGAGTVSASNNATGHVGVVTLASSAVQNTVGRISQSSQPVNMVELQEMEGIVMPNSGTATMSARFGALASSSTAGEGSNGAYFSFAPGTSANWRCITKDGSGTTATTTTVAYATSTWYVLTIKFTPTKVEFYINDTLVATHTTNILATAVFTAFAIETNEAVDKTIDIDRFSLITQPLGRRYT